MGSCKDLQMFPILLVKTSVKISEKTTTTPGLAPFQLTVVVFVVGSAFEAKNLPENSLILSSEPLICGTIYEGVYGATQVKQEGYMLSKLVVVAWALCAPCRYCR